MLQLSSQGPEELLFQQAEPITAHSLLALPGSAGSASPCSSQERAEPCNKQLCMLMATFPFLLSSWLLHIWAMALQVLLASIHPGYGSVALFGSYSSELWSLHPSGFYAPELRVSTSLWLLLMQAMGQQVRRPPLKFDYHEPGRLSRITPTHGPTAAGPASAPRGPTPAKRRAEGRSAPRMRGRGARRLCLGRWICPARAGGGGVNERGRGRMGVADGRGRGQALGGRGRGTARGGVSRSAAAEEGGGAEPSGAELSRRQPRMINTQDRCAAPPSLCALFGEP